MELNEEQLRGQIAAKESELQQLVQKHAADQQKWNQQAAANQQRAHHLEGAIAALQELLPKTE